MKDLILLVYTTPILHPNRRLLNSYQPLQNINALQKSTVCHSTRPHLNLALIVLVFTKDSSTINFPRYGTMVS